MSRRAGWVGLCMCLVFGVAQGGVEGDWTGSIVLPSGDLAIEVQLGQLAGQWSGSCDIPAQGAAGLKLDAIVVEGDEVGFRLRGVPGEPTFRGKLEGERIVGSFTQSGMSFPFSLSRAVGGKRSVVRPQDPGEPLPYRSEEMRVSVGPVELVGTLTLPPGPGPFPAVLLLSGSGAQDRNSEVFGHRPFLVLADALTRNGVAVLRLDDRGVGESEGSLGVVNHRDLAEDALRSVDVLRAHDAIDPACVGLIGHSEGGLVAPLAAVRSKEIAFIVLLAAPGVPGDELLVRQVELLSRAAGLADADLAKIRRAQRQLLDGVRVGVSGARQRELVEALIRAQSSGAATGAALQSAIDSAVEGTMGQLRTPWFVEFVAYDPRPALRLLTVPVLALGGALDLQVDPAQNLPEIQRALEVAGNPHVEIHEFPQLNHLFQTATTGSPGEYFSIAETFAPAALEKIVGWIGGGESRPTVCMRALSPD